MVLITEDLVRKRAEHNNSELSTLEELSLHQLDIEKIEHLDRWCKNLQILYLQSNLIPRIESVTRLKNLQYLNLALNNITIIENLEGCEALNKLDLTVNFIGLICSVERLKSNIFLKTLYLTGNPCTDYVGYRDYVIAHLPGLTQLDGQDVTKTERILAMQQLSSLKCEMLRQEKIYRKKQNNVRHNDCEDNKWYTETDPAHLEKKSTEGNEKEDFWNKPCKYTPESRLEAHRYLEDQKMAKQHEKKKFDLYNPSERVVKYFTSEGRPLNINQSQMQFSLIDDHESNMYILDVAFFKHLDTNLIDVDVQPNYVRIKFKNKVLQLALSSNVSPDRSTATRSQVTGHLVLHLPKLNAIVNKNKIMKKQTHCNDKNMQKKLEEKLDVRKKECVDIYNIVKNEEDIKQTIKRDVKENKIKLKALEEFIENMDVPPLV